MHFMSTGQLLDVSYDCGQALPIAPFMPKYSKGEEMVLSCFPNPSSHQVRVVANIEGKGTLRVLDSSGKEVAVYEVEKETDIYVDKFAAGVYLFQLFLADNKHVKTIKFVKK